MRRPGRNHTAAFEAQFAVAALKDDKTLVELAETDAVAHRRTSPDHHPADLRSPRVGKFTPTLLGNIPATLTIIRYGRPDIFNTDQGSQFTSADFTDVLIANGIRISMDGKGRWLDAVLVERLWRSLKYEQGATSNYVPGWPSLY